MFPHLPAHATFVADTCLRDTKNVSDFVQKHFVSATNVSQFARARKRHEQQCFRNNVSSFATALPRNNSRLVVRTGLQLATSRFVVRRLDPQSAMVALARAVTCYFVTVSFSTHRLLHSYSRFTSQTRLLIFRTKQCSATNL